MPRRLKNWIESYMVYTQHSEAPDEMHKWAAIGTIAGALRRRVWFDMGYFTWYPNFFMFFVAPPGIVSKSTTMGIGIDLLREVPGIKFGPSAITWQALIKALADAQEHIEFQGEFYPMAALTIAVSELGTFLDPRNREMIDVLVDLWDGRQGAWDKVTKTGSSESIINPWIHIIGCTTPSWIAENFGDYFFGGGLASRSVMVYAEEKRKLVAYPKRHFETGMGELKARLIHDLTEMSEMFGEFTLTDEAYAWGDAWYKRHWTEDDHSHIEGDKFRAYLARKQTHLHKVAMILSAAENSSLVIEPQHLITADKEITSLEQMMPSVYGKMNAETEQSIAADILSFLYSKKKGVNKPTLYREFFKSISVQTFDKIMASLIQTGLVKSRVTDSGMYFQAVPLDEVE